MSSMDCRIVLGEAEFRAIGSRDTTDEYRFYAFYDRLIVDNEQAAGLSNEQAKQRLTRGQLLLSRVGMFHSQVNNGGIEQFFWNCAELIFDLHDDLALLGVPAAVTAYEKALDALAGEAESWIDLRERWGTAGDSPDFEDFVSSRELLDVEWFNAEFFGERDSTPSPRPRREGLGDAIARAAITFVLEHRVDFVRASS